MCLGRKVAFNCAKKSIKIAMSSILVAAKDVIPAIAVLANQLMMLLLLLPDSEVTHCLPSSGELEIVFLLSLGARGTKFMQLRKSYDSLIISLECLAAGNQCRDHLETD